MFINKKLTLITYNNETQNIKLIPNINELNIIYGISNSGLGFVSFNPNSNFNSLTVLQNNASYLVEAKENELPVIVQSITTTSSPTTASPTTPRPDCLGLCEEAGVDTRYNRPEEVLALSPYTGEFIYDSCHCQCDISAIINGCFDIGYNDTDVGFTEITDIFGRQAIISQTCSVPANCKCAEGYEYSQNEQKCIEKNPAGACCINGECTDERLENCIGGLFMTHSSCDIIAKFPLSDDAKSCGTCTPKIGYTGYNCLNTNNCVYCNVGEFFDSNSCICYENCSDIINNLPSCEFGARNPNTCECCTVSTEDRFLGVLSFGYSKCLDDCAFCQVENSGKVVWNEQKCVCECESEDDLINCKALSPMLVTNPQTCDCECPSGSREFCENRGYDFIGESDYGGVSRNQCRCDCSSEQARLAQQKCPQDKVNVPGAPDRDRWNPFTCECDCSDKPACVSPKIRNSLTCSCECPLAIEQGVPWFLVKCPNSNEDLNSETCQCEPKKYGAWCTGQFCPPKGQEGSVFITTGCEEGTLTSWRLENSNYTVQSFQEGKACKEISCETEELPAICTTTTTSTTTSTTTTTTTAGPTTTNGPTTTPTPCSGDEYCEPFCCVDGVCQECPPVEYQWYCTDC